MKVNRISLVLLLLMLIMTLLNNENTLFTVYAEQSQEHAFFQTDSDAGKLTIRYFNLEDSHKSGDAILIKGPEGDTMLIDSGTFAVGDQLSEYLAQLQVHSLDYSVASHPHHDHIGGYQKLIGNIPIRQFLLPDIPALTEANKKLQQLLAENQLHIEYIKKNDQFKLGEEVFIEVLHPGPLKSKGKWSTKEINESALVLKISYRNHTFLLASDIYKATEKQLIEEYGDQLKVDFLHIPHHGHQTSSSKTFIKQVSPKYAVISSNRSKWKKVNQMYQSEGVKTYITERDGHIKITSDGQEFDISGSIK
ncbi:putative hydrolase [Bacillus sp. TS-2]|nr:putative hydrolase [Bacillus sp. TS-2]